MSTQNLIVQETVNCKNKCQLLLFSPDNRYASVEIETV